MIVVVGLANNVDSQGRREKFFSMGKISNVSH